MDGVQILSEKQNFCSSNILLLLLSCSSNDINEVKKNNRNSKEVRLMIILRMNMPI
jgi:hypothetical protein